MEIQRVLGSDIAMVFDECPPHDAPAREQKTGRRTHHPLGARVPRTTAGARTTRVRHRAGRQQRGLREECAKALVAMEFDGYAIGGVSVGEPEPEMLKAIEFTEPFLPAAKARYAMGLGTPAQMLELIARGVDMFDCVLPTRVARTGTAFTRRGAFGIKGGSYKADFRPIEEGCGCFACRHFTRAYLRHLLNVNEILGLRMVSVHNSHMFLQVMADTRAHLAAGTFAEFYREFIANYTPSQKILAARKKETER